MVKPLPRTDETKHDGSPHSLRYVAIRIVAALLVVGAFVAVDQIWIEDDPEREQFGATVKAFEVVSAELERTLPAKVVVPPKAPPRDRSLLVFLHGRGEDERSYLVEQMFEGLTDQRGRAPVVAFPFGGDSSYWHDREGGNWASYVLDEAIPQIVDRYDVDPDRIAIGGISMGGYGAFNVARLDPDGFCGVGGHSPAIWESAGDSAPGAFDDEEDFAANDVIEIAGDDPSPYADLRLWLDAGDDDPFLGGNEALEETLRAGGGRPVVKRSPGGHDDGYWNGNWQDYFRFYAHALNECAVEDATDDEQAATAEPSSASSRPSREAPGDTSSRSNRGGARAGR